ncbi:MAG TPA: DNA polymerase III subunit beta [Patescibacteria group bacterium]|nr:DNA polymerase III subunit beta [Patescibacteria group bacterium]
MKLTVLQENLTKAITQASRFASTRSQLPILGNILLKATKTKLNISSTNLEISVLIQIGAKIESEGEISIPSKVISELVSNLPKENVTLESEKEQLKIETSGFTSKVLGMNATDFPKIPESVVKPLSLPKKEILESLSQVVFAASADETRPVLTGVLFVLDKEGLTIVATDGFRLSRKKIALKNKKDLVEQKIVIPKGVLGELGRSLEDVSEFQFEIQEKEKQVIFGLGDIVLSSRLLEGEYPDFEKIIPKSSTITVRLDKEEFLRAVKLASIFAREAANVVKLKLDKNSVKVFAESSNSGSQETQVEAKIDGEVKDFEIAFNYRFLEEFLHSVSGEEVKMEFTTTDKAGVFTDSSDSNYLHLIMPVRVQS